LIAAGGEQQACWTEHIVARGNQHLRRHRNSLCARRGSAKRIVAQHSAARDAARVIGGALGVTAATAASWRGMAANARCGGSGWRKNCGVPARVWRRRSIGMLRWRQRPSSCSCMAA